MKKMYVLLVPGTWSGSAKWTHDGSKFRAALETGLKSLGYHPDIYTYLWSTKNDWFARTETANKINKRLNYFAKERSPDCEYLLIGHSHGGNIATEAVHKTLVETPDMPIRGVVCLNTPFLTNQLRISNGFLISWLFFTLLLWAFLFFGGIDAPLDLNDTLWNIFQRVGNPLQLTLKEGLFILMLVLAFFFVGSKLLQKNKNEDIWEPRPNVLCLSCPDDEAITLLGLFEGISNLPQLFLHPLAFAFILVFGLYFWYTNDYPLCGGLDNYKCLIEQAVITFSVTVVNWLTIGLACGLLGAFVMWIIFGLPIRKVLRTLVTRILVSYTPLNPSETHFRGIVELPSSISNYTLLFHSAIYESPQTVKEICKWLQQYPIKLVGWGELVNPNK
jgi:pimeloyl-ACP methyl ester carboxylesterase